jgi:hypothetical protein
LVFSGAPLLLDTRGVSSSSRHAQKIIGRKAGRQAPPAAATLIRSQ